MAKYERSFLVPYLQDICTLYMVKRKLNYNYKALCLKKNSIQEGQDNPCPSMPNMENTVTFGRIFGLLVGAFFLFTGIVCVVHGMEDLIFGLVVCALVIGALGGFIIFYSVKMMKEAKEDNKYKWEKYKQQKQQYEEIKKLNEKARTQLPSIQSQIQECTEEIQQVNGLLDQAYNINVIPNQYRDIYASVYLYDYFRGSREDDLAMALNTFVLEQIKDKLDIIIENQTQTLLHQRIMLANQQQYIEQQSEHNQKMRHMISQMQISLEEQNQYLGMIETNTATTAFFSAANYIETIYN